jgi:hypothetical protein
VVVVPDVTGEFKSVHIAGLFAQVAGGTSGDWPFWIPEVPEIMSDAE